MISAAERDHLRDIRIEQYRNLGLMKLYWSIYHPSDPNPFPRMALWRSAKRRVPVPVERAPGA